MKRFYLYDPRINVTSNMDEKQIMDILDMYPSEVERIIERKSRVKSIGCYISESPLTLKNRQVLYAKESFPDKSWKSVEGSDGAFLISNHGRIKRIYKHVSCLFFGNKTDIYT